ncbi:ABC transporter substrate-binding protein [Cellulomonas sp. Marseille-Q8402]
MSRVGVLAMTGVFLVGCTNTGTDGVETQDGADAAQEVQTPDAASAGTGCTVADYGVEPIDLEGAVIGFSQSEPDAASWRAAETQSLREEAAARGAELVVTNANNELSKQISDIQEMLAQGVDALIVAPVNSDGLDPALTAARDAGVAVLTIDRKVSNDHCADYVAYLGSDFEEQGRRAADALAEATGGTAQVAVLLGSSGNNVTDGRRDGFAEQVAAEYPDITIVAEQTANASRTEGQAVTEQLLQAHPEIDAVYAYNDEEGLGAMAAVEAAGLLPGEDVKIVSVDGTRTAVQAIVDGTYTAVIESNPRFGPLAFDTLASFFAGEEIPEDIIIADGVYDAGNAADGLARAF